MYNQRACGKRQRSSYTGQRHNREKYNKNGLFFVSFDSCVNFENRPGMWEDEEDTLEQVCPKSRSGGVVKIEKKT